MAVEVIKRVSHAEAANTGHGIKKPGRSGEWIKACESLSTENHASLGFKSYSINVQKKKITTLLQ